MTYTLIKQFTPSPFFLWVHHGRDVTLAPDFRFANPTPNTTRLSILRYACLLCFCLLLVFFDGQYDKTNAASLRHL